jgi:hypothetical protein
MLADLFAEAIRNAPPEATTAECLAAALDSVTPAFTPERHDLARQRQAVTAAHDDLRERALLKRARLAAAMADALRARGTDHTTALLAAEIGVLAFSTSFSRWSEAGNGQQPYSEMAHAALRDLQARAAALGADTDARI